MPECVALSCRGDAATRAKGRRPTGPGCRPFARMSASTTPTSFARSWARAGRRSPTSCPMSVSGCPDLRQTPTVEDPQQARFRLFDSLTSFLKSAAQTQPLVLVLDDLHWADERFAAPARVRGARAGAAMRLLLVGTYRDVELSRRHPLSQTLAELTRERLFDRLLLRGLSRDDVGGFVQATCGISPPDDLVSAVYAADGGQPALRHRDRPAPGSGGRADDGASLRTGELERPDSRGSTRGDRPAPGASVRQVQRDAGCRLRDRQGVRARRARASRSTISPRTGSSKCSRRRCRLG